MEKRQRVNWTQEETEYLKRNYHNLPSQQVYAHFSRHDKDAVKAKACCLGLLAQRYWTEKDLEYLNDNYGVTPDAEICQHLQRSLNAVHIASVRKLHICRKTNLYTAHAVARELGFLCSKTVTAWRQRGLLKGEKSTIPCGGGLMWHFPYENIESFVRANPWLFARSRMQESYFRSIVDEEYAKDPWVSLSAACKMIGVSSFSAAMSSYLKKRWLHPIKRPIEGGNHWTWIFRKSDIDAFLANDPRRGHFKKVIKSRQRRRLRHGLPVQIWLVWKMECPVCHRIVNIEANPHLKSGMVKKLFEEKYCPDGPCSHKNRCRVEKPLPLYRIRKSTGRSKTYPPHWPDRQPKVLAGVL